MRINDLKLALQRWYSSERMVKVRAVVWQAARVFRLLFLPDFKALWRLSRNDYPGGLRSGLITREAIASWQRASTPARKVHVAFIKVNPLVMLAWYLCALVFAGLALWLGYSFFIVSHWSERLNCFMGFCAALTFSVTGFYNTWCDTTRVAAYKRSIRRYIQSSPGHKE